MVFPTWTKRREPWDRWALPPLRGGLAGRRGWGGHTGFLPVPVKIPAVPYAAPAHPAAGAPSGAARQGWSVLP